MQFITSGDRIAVENFTIGDLYTITFVGGTYINTACIGKGADFVTFQRNLPELLFSLTMETAELVSSIELYSGGTGTNSYNDLTNKPQINDVELVGNKSLSDLGIQPTISDIDTIRSGAAAGATAVQPAALADYQPIIDSSHKLDADLVDDTSSTHKFATAAQLSQIEANKNNILSVADQSTQYNIAQGRARTLDSVTSTVSGYTITFSGTSSGTSSFSFLKAFSPPKSGDYVWKSTNGVTIGGTPISVYMWDATANVGVPVTDIDGGLKVNLDSTHMYTLAFTLQANKVVTGTYSVMIISKDLWDSGITDFQPYAMSNAELTAEVKPSAYSNPTPQSTDITLQSGGYYKIGNSVTVCIRATVSNALAAWAPIFSGFPVPITDNSIAENSAVVAVSSNAGVGIGITKRGIMQGFDAIPAGTLLLNCTYLCV